MIQILPNGKNKIKCNRCEQEMRSFTQSVHHHWIRKSKKGNNEITNLGKYCINTKKYCLVQFKFLSIPFVLLIRNERHCEQLLGARAVISHRPARRHREARAPAQQPKLSGMNQVSGFREQVHTCRSNRHYTHTFNRNVL